MAFEFSENLTIQVPNVTKQLEAFSESEFREGHGLVIEIAAIHEGMTANFNYYSAEALKDAIETWVTPYPKPIILNHDLFSEPLGRVVAAKMDQEADGTEFVRLQVAITDPEAVAKVSDKRYLTGSVGGKADEATCSVCGENWSQASVFAPPCAHKRGKTYKGKLAYLELGSISFKEFSFVNSPADERAQVLAPGKKGAVAASEEEGWVKAARVFSINMDKEEILEYSESAKDVNILESTKDSQPVYLQLKGAFLSVLGTDYPDDNIKENSSEELIVADKDNQESEDILAISEGLSADLADLANAKSDEDEDFTEAETDADPDGTEPDSRDGGGDYEKAEPGPKREVPEKPESEPTDTTSRESDEEDDEDEPAEEPVVEEAAADPDTDDSEEEETQEEAPTAEESSDTELDVNNESLESRVEELEAVIDALTEENTKLKNLVKRNLAERVVDTKITLGLVESDEREEIIVEHMNRSAASLADSLRDFAAMPTLHQNENEPTGELPTVEDMSAAVEDESEGVITEGETKSAEVDPEALFIDVLMGRQKL